MQKKILSKGAKGKKGAKTRVGWQSPKNMMHKFMIIVFNQRIYKNRSPSRLEAHLVYKHTQKPKKLISNAR